MTDLKTSARGGLLAFAALTGGLLLGAVPASAQQCLEQIVSLQSRMPQTQSGNSGPSDRQSVGAQLDQQPTPGSLAAAGVKQPDSGAQGYLNKAQNLQAAGDEKGCLQAVDEARKIIDKK